MKYDYDIICIGLGPAGMAVSIMGAEMGLKVCSIEKNKIGGECMNVGCIPSKSLLRIAKLRNAGTHLKAMELGDIALPEIASPFAKIQEYLDFINDKKNKKMFEQVDLVLNQGSAKFVDDHTIAVGDRQISARKIFIATGTEPMIPPIKGLDQINYLTNNNMFKLDQIPQSMTIIGGGAIGSEMAQAFSRLGCKCSIIQMDDYLVPIGDRQAGEVLEAEFAKEGIAVYNSKKITHLEQKGDQILLHSEDGLCLKSQKLLVSAGRNIKLADLELEKAGVQYSRRGIEVNPQLQTNIPHIFAVGDCNGGVMLSHAAMHQGMIALMNALTPGFFKQKFKKFVIPWTVFTEPQISYAGMRETELQTKKIKYKTYIANYEDYGAAIAENVGLGFVKVFASTFGKIYGVSIVGEGSGEMINEWALAIQKKIRLHEIMFLAHSFPTMGFLSKRVTEIWMMDKMKSPFVRFMCKCMFRIA